MAARIIVIIGIVVRIVIAAEEVTVMVGKAEAAVMEAAAMVHRAAVPAAAMITTNVHTAAGMHAAAHMAAAATTHVAAATATMPTTAADFGDEAASRGFRRGRQA